MALIYLTQYLRPNGRRRTVSVDRPDHIAKAADFIISHGFRFECEVLVGGFVDLTISDDLDDYAHVIANNDTDVIVKLDKLITEFNVAEALKEREILR